MPELRHDALTGRLVVLAASRASRPKTIGSAEVRESADTCPFCPNHEHETPPEIARTGSGRRPGLTLFQFAALSVVLRKFEAVFKPLTMGKSIEEVSPVTYALPAESTAIEFPVDPFRPLRYVE